MDRDLATKLVDTMGDIKTALETIATNTTPDTPAANVNSREEETRETVTQEPEEAPATRSTKK